MCTKIDTLALIWVLSVCKLSTITIHDSGLHLQRETLGDEEPCSQELHLCGAGHGRDWVEGVPGEHNIVCSNKSMYGIYSDISIDLAFLSYSRIDN